MQMVTMPMRMLAPILTMLAMFTRRCDVDAAADDEDRYR